MYVLVFINAGCILDSLYSLDSNLYWDLG